MRLGTPAWSARACVRPVPHSADSRKVLSLTAELARKVRPQRVVPLQALLKMRRPQRRSEAALFPVQLAEELYARLSRHPTELNVC